MTLLCSDVHVLFITLLSCLSCTVCLTLAYIIFFVPFFAFDFYLYLHTRHSECFEHLYMEPSRNQHSISLCNMSELSRWPFSNGFIHWNMFVFMINSNAFRTGNSIHVIMHAFTIAFLRMFMPC